MKLKSILLIITTLCLLSSPVFAMREIGDFDIRGSLILLPTTYSTQNGVIYKGTDRFIHDFNYGDNETVITNGYNIFFGKKSGNFTMGSTATSTYQSSCNIGIGEDTLYSNTTGYSNTAVGVESLALNTTGYNNVGLGQETLQHNTTGHHNVGVGLQALNANTTGHSNAGVGTYVLRNITTGYGNTAIGDNTGLGITTGNNNTIIGGEVVGLSSTLSNTVIIADGEGHQRIVVNSSGQTKIPSLAADPGLHWCLQADQNGTMSNTGAVCSGGSSNWTRDSGKIYPTVPTDDLVVKKPWADIRAYGAVCDGSTDDNAYPTYYVQAAFTASNNIYIPPLICIIGTEITGSSNQNVFGVPGKSTLKTKTGSGDHYILFIDSKSNINIEGVTFDGNSTSGGILNISRSTDFKITSSIFKNSTSIGLNISSSHRGSVTNSYFTNIKNLTYPAGPRIADDYSEQSSDIRVENNMFYDMDGIHLSGTNLSLIGNTFKTMRESAVYTGEPTSSNIVVSGNVIDTTTSIEGSASGIEAAGDHVTITGNILKNTFGITYQRVTSGTATGVVITGNEIYSASSTCGGIGLMATGGNISNVVVEGNRISNTDGYAIVIQRSGSETITNVAMIGNIVYGSSGSFIAYGGATWGTGCEIAHNIGYTYP
jgi:hypothetical protein